MRLPSRLSSLRRATRRRTTAPWRRRRSSTASCRTSASPCASGTRRRTTTGRWPTGATRRGCSGTSTTASCAAIPSACECAARIRARCAGTTRRFPTARPTPSSRCSSPPVTTRACGLSDHVTRAVHGRLPCQHRVATPSEDAARDLIAQVSPALAHICDVLYTPARLAESLEHAAAAAVIGADGMSVALPRTPVCPLLLRARRWCDTCAAAPAPWRAPLLLARGRREQASGPTRLRSQRPA